MEKRGEDDDYRNKRARVDTGDDSPAQKRNSPESRRIRDDLLEILDDVSDLAGDCDPATHDLDSVIRSFEEEILVPSPTPQAEERLPDSAESPPALGRLLEPSDDALGLPTRFSGEAGSKHETVDLPAMYVDFEEEVLRYDSFGLGIVGESDGSNDDNGTSSGDLVTAGGLFNYSDPGHDLPDYTWLSVDTLPAL